MNDDRDLHDTALDALLRTHSAETPPPAVDAAVLAAAHRAVDGEMRARPARATQPWRWWMPLAAAAAIGVVVVGIFPLAPTLVEQTPPAISDSPMDAATPSRSSASQPAPPPASDANSVRRDAEASRPVMQSFRPEPARPMVSRESAATAASPASPATAPAPASPSNAPAPASPATASPAASVASPPAAVPDAAALAAPPASIAKATAPEHRAESKVERDAAAASAPLEQRKNATGAIRAIPEAPPAPQQSGGAASSQRARAPEATPRAEGMRSDRQEPFVAQPRTADEWIARIRTLRSDARPSEAMRALADFRAAFSDADARLPQDLRDWAKTVQ